LGHYNAIYYTAIHHYITYHGENDFAASAKRYVNIASANQNCCGEDVIIVTIRLIVSSTITVVAVTCRIVTTTFCSAEAILAKNFAEATKSFSP